MPARSRCPEKKSVRDTPAAAARAKKKKTYLGTRLELQDSFRTEIRIELKKIEPIFSCNCARHNKGESEEIQEAKGQRRGEISRH